MSLRHCVQTGCKYFPERWIAVDGQLDKLGYCHGHALELGLTGAIAPNIATRRLTLTEKADKMIAEYGEREAASVAVQITEHQHEYYTDLHGNRQESPF